MFLVATMLILFLAANTSYNAFPRLAALLADDGYMPRQFSFRGDRLAFSWGIVLLAVVAALASGSVARRPSSSRSTRSACSCASRSPRRDGPPLAARPAAGWRRRLAINGFGALADGRRPRDRPWSRSSAGAYLVVILIPVLVGWHAVHHRQYAASARSWRSRRTS